ncbi:MAG: hypothetical protein BGO01_14185 [Armatimonadetes bacterium 55-13]|nr:hypothetical protein [Armatimonadota bacterium]OJU64870.1 MAG: hypothetical protein BGO01_14185 [Armatimonadetes bacterium 55-13]
MTPLMRALYGALLGSILTLIVHPRSRPFILGAFEFSKNPAIRAKTNLPGPFPKALPDPTTPLNASMWIHVAAEKLAAREPLTRKELTALANLSASWQKKDPQNAFWRFARTVFLNADGNSNAARAEWLSAARCLIYNDQQSNRLDMIRKEIGSQFFPGAWQFAYVYRFRSVAFSRLVESYVRDLIMAIGPPEPTATGLKVESKSELELRYATMLNGALMREGSRSLAIMRSGIAIVEIASHPKELRSETSIKRLLIAHSDFKEALKSQKMIDQANRVQEIYNNNDAWSALSQREDTEENAAYLTFQSSVIPALPGAILMVAGIGFLITRLSLLMKYVSGQSERAFLSLALTLGLLSSGLILYLTHSILAFAASGLACGFIAVRPKFTRRKPPEGLGPLFTFANLMLAPSFLLLTSLFFLSRTIPVVANIEAFNMQIDLFSNADLLAGLSLLVLCMLYLISPLWAFAQHIRTAVVLTEGLKMFGSMLLTMGLVFTVVATPICIYFEDQAQPILKSLVENEPTYYVGL